MQDTKENIQYVRDYLRARIRCIKEKIKLEDGVRDLLLHYFSKRSEIENIYSEELTNLSRSLRTRLYKCFYEDKKARDIFNRLPANELFRSVLLFIDSTASVHRKTSQDLREKTISVTGSFADFRKENVQTCFEVIRICNDKLLDSINKLDKTKASHEKISAEVDSAYDKLGDKSEIFGSVVDTFCNFVTGKKYEDRNDKTKYKWNRSLVKFTEEFNKHLVQIAAVNGHKKQYLKNILWCSDVIEGSLYKDISEYLLDYAKAEIVALDERKSGSLNLIKLIDEIECKPNADMFMNCHEFASLMKCNFLPPKCAIYPYDGPLKSLINNSELEELYGKLIIERRELNELIKRKIIERNNIVEAKDIHPEIPNSGNNSESRMMVVELDAYVRLFYQIKASVDAQISVLNDIGIVPMITLRNSSSNAKLNNPSGIELGVRYGTACDSYERRNDMEVSASKGDRFLILRDCGNGFFDVQNLSTMKTGNIPASFVNILSPSTCSVVLPNLEYEGFSKMFQRWKSRSNAAGLSSFKYPRDPKRNKILYSKTKWLNRNKISNEDNYDSECNTTYIEPVGIRSPLSVPM